MSIDRERYGGPVTFCCDDCGEINDTHCENFAGALAKLKSRGWVVRRDGDDWQHFCGDCK